MQGRKSAMNGCRRANVTRTTVPVAASVRKPAREKVTTTAATLSSRAAAGQGAARCPVQIASSAAANGIMRLSINAMSFGFAVRPEPSVAGDPERDDSTNTPDW